jgi:hypothetical protein
MTGKRMISTGLKDSEKLMDCSSDTVRLLFVWLCLEVDDDGKMQGKPRTIKKIFFGDRDNIKVSACEKMIKELSELGLIIYYKDKDQENYYIEIPKWTCINSIRKDCYKPSEILSFSKDVHTPLHSRNVTVTDMSHSIVKLSKDKSSIDKFSLGGKIKISEFVSMTMYQYIKLTNERFSGNEDLTDTAIEILNNYKGSSGKPYESDYHAILVWVIKEMEKKESKLIPKNKHQGILDWLAEKESKIER